MATDVGQDKAVPQDVLNYLSTLEANLTTRYACSYCGDRFSKKHYRDAHEKDNHVDKDGKFLELTCDLCQEKLPTPEQYRRYGNIGCGVFKGEIHTKLERFLPKNQHSPRKFLHFENWCNGEVSKIEHHFRK